MTPTWEMAATLYLYHMHIQNFTTKHVTSYHGNFYSFDYACLFMGSATPSFIWSQDKIIHSMDMLMKVLILFYVKMCIYLVPFSGYILSLSHSALCFETKEDYCGYVLHPITVLKHYVGLYCCTIASLRS